jgi:TPR repeat protein
VKSDYQKAEFEYNEAAKHGYEKSLALYSIGLLHFHGGPGMPPDCNAARMWFEQAVAQGNSQAQRWLEANQCR